VDAGLGGPSRAFADIGSHLCDLIEFVTNDRIVRIGSVSRTLFTGRANHEDVQTEDLVAAVFATKTGAVGNLLVSQVAPGRKNRLVIEISGTESTVQFDQEAPETLWLGKRAGSEMLVRDPDALSPEAARLSVLPAGHPQGYQDAFNAFVADTYAAIKGDNRDGLPTFRDGLRSAVLTESIIESSKSGEWVDVKEVKELEGVR
jgi:predicted dehydrogenase